MKPIFRKEDERRIENMDMYKGKQKRKYEDLKLNETKYYRKEEVFL